MTNDTAHSSLPKAYIPAQSEASWYSRWVEHGHFRSSPNTALIPYSILMPPPNVTGVLHFGHVINHTIQDIYIRWNRLQGKETCWFPGLDHAGIATQTKVEEALRSEGLSRHDIGRDAFIQRTWDWKEKYGDVILSQIRQLGDACDWDRLLFTLDDSAADAVREVFIRLFDEGLIYRGKRIINWSPVAQSALSDEEVIFKEVREHIFTMRYHLEDGSATLLVATVRPETIFADVAVAVNPKDERYKHLVGKNVIVPLSGQVVPIIADDYADPEFGTGCVKVTPAHDPNDFLIGERHNLSMPSCINADATLNDLAGKYRGMDRFVARKAVVEDLKSADLIEKIEEYTHNVGFSERGKEAVEPYLSDQWFVRMKPLAEPALNAVKNGDIRIYPDHWSKTYEHWMNNIRDWCISRQLWWGHRIPVYYTPDGAFTAASSEDEARTKLGLAPDVELIQDPDVLDTWFSSWLWPMTTMKWRGEPMGHESAESAELMKYYLPSDLLVTGPDIIFFWVARMVMATLKFQGKVPFKDVYFTSIIRDSIGRKLSKSLGNSPDPLSIFDKYGSDAVRFTMIYLAPMGTDVRLDIEESTQDIPSMELGRNFANKLWNAARFLQMKTEEAGVAADDSVVGDSVINDTRASLIERWIDSRYQSTLRDASTALEQYRITDYAKVLYDFVWSDFCSWYVEMFKVRFNAADPVRRRAMVAHSNNILEGVLKLLHPVMPFVTEEIWHGLYNGDESVTINKSGFPRVDTVAIDTVVEDQFGLMQSLVECIRRMRSELRINPGEKIPATISANADTVAFIREHSDVISSLCRISDLTVDVGIAKPDGAVADVVRGIEVYLVVANTIDTEAEIVRLSTEAERLRGMIKGVQAKLGNEGFMAKAKPEVIVNEQKKLSDWTNTVETIEKNIKAMQ